MQVTHVQDKVTHAIIGGGATTDFGITNNAEFFNILSSTLYSDQILAVVREVICNAWDAHIEAKCTGTPVEITLRDGKFIIKDFGKGIHHDDMGVIYTTYGNSTKKNDGNQTGGFGLGCKAPFAYADHFEVISCNNGTKTIYALTKSSAQAGGKPGMTAIAQFPTTETGLTVTIPIKVNDTHKFDNLITRITSEGDMNAVFNGNPVEKINFDTDKAPYMVLEEPRHSNWGSFVMVRYGNVIYPMPVTEQVNKLYREVQGHVQNIARNHGYYVLFQAPPHSIAVTPSRETLSMQSHTVATLNKLMQDFLDTLPEFEKEVTRLSTECIAEAVQRKDVLTLLAAQASLPFPTTDEAAKRMITPEERAREFLTHSYPPGAKFRKEDLSRRAEQLSKAGLIDRGLASTFLKELKNDKGRRTDFIMRRIMRPMFAKLAAAGMRTEGLYQVDERITSRWYSNQAVVPAYKMHPELMENALPYMRKVVVVSTSQRTFKAAYDNKEAFKDVGLYGGFFLYVPSLKKGKAEEAVKFWTDQGYKVIDLTVKAELPAAVRAKVVRAPAEKKEKKEGYLTLRSCVADASYESLSFNLKWGEKHGDAFRTKTPSFVHVTSFSEECKHSLDGFTREGKLALINLYGDHGVVVNSEPQARTLNKKGVPTLEQFLIDTVFPRILNNQAIKQHYQFNLKRFAHKVRASCGFAKQRSAVDNALHSIGYLYDCAEMRKHFKVPPALQGEDLELFNLLDSLEKKVHHFSSDFITAFRSLNEQLEKVKTHRNVGILFRHIYASHGLPMVSLYELTEVLDNSTSTSKKKMAKSLILKAIYG